MCVCVHVHVSVCVCVRMPTYIHLIHVCVLDRNESILHAYICVQEDRE